MNAPDIERARPRFAVEAGRLVVGGVDIERLAARVGSTPFYAVERAALTARVARLRRHLPAGVAVHYAIKANPMASLVCHMARLVDGLDVASAGELTLALDSGMSPQHISFAGPGKRERELMQAVAAGVLVNVESARELPILSAASEQLGLPARVALRINPHFALKGSGMKMGGGPAAFGVDLESAPAVLAEIGARGLAFEGFHVFGGSQNLSAQAICEAQQAALECVSLLADHAPAAPTTINLGGGFGIPYFAGEAPLVLAPIAMNLAQITATVSARWPACALVIELGRYLVGEAGVYVCRVLERKISRGQIFLVTDGGMHHHLAASGNFGQVARRNFPLALANRMDAPPEEKVTVVGPLCTPLDVLGKAVDLPRANAGDLVAVFQSGAYGLSASPTGFLSHPRALEVLV